MSTGTATINTETAHESSFERFRKAIGLPLAIAVALLIWFMGAPAGLSPQGHKAIVLFAAVFILYLTESISLPITSLAIAPAAVLMGIVKVNGALESFASSSVYLMVGAFILATAMVKSRLANRITYLIMRAIGTSALRISLGITLTNILLAFMVPSTTARTAILLPVVVGLVQAFKAGKHSKLAAGMLLILCFTNSTIAAGILTAAVPNPVTVDFVFRASKHVLSYQEWFILGFPPALIMTFFTWWIVNLMFKPEVKEIPGGSSFVQQELAKLGPISRNEIVALVIFVAIVLAWMFGTTLGIDNTTACLAGACLFFLPRIGFLSWNDANKGISWQIVFVAGGGIGLGEILMKTGAAKWIAEHLFALMGLHGASIIVILLVVMLVVQYLHFIFVGTTAMATAILPIVLGFAETAGVPAVVLALPAGMIVGGYPLLMFYNTLPNILAYGTGELGVEDFPKVGFIICTVACLVYALCAITYWQWIGFTS